MEKDNETKNKNTVLIIEDEEILLELLKEKLERAGYVVEVAKDGVSGLEKIRKIKPDLVLLDVVLPKMNGFDVLEELNKDGTLPGLPIIVISNSGQPVEIERADKLGARDYLIKLNFDPDEVLQKVNNFFHAESVMDVNGEEKPEGEREAAPAMPSGAEEVDWKGVVLVVEDDVLLSELLSTKLQERKFKVYQAVSAEQASEVLKQHAVDLICLDILLPGKDGFEFLEEIKEEPKLKNIPVLILSNLGQQEEVEKGLRLGAVGYLIKATLSPGEIVSKVESLLIK